MQRCLRSTEHAATEHAIAATEHATAATEHATEE
jgi:hypothetical protein